MDQSEFHETIDSVIQGFLPRIPKRYVEGIEEELDVGEFQLAVESLLATLVDDAVPVTVAERGALDRVVRYLEQPTDDLDRLITIEDGDENAT